MDARPEAIATDRTDYAPFREYRAPTPKLPESWMPFWKSFVRNLRASQTSERTMKAYGAAIADLAKFLAPAPPIRALTREQLEEFFAAFQVGHKASYVAIHFRGLRRWFNWLVEEDELGASPMRRIKEPKVPDEPIPILSIEDIRKLLASCRHVYPRPGTDQEFRDRRDMALIRFLIDTGARRGGTTTLRLDQLDLDAQGALVRAKGGDTYEVRLGVKATRDIDRYLRLRAQHRFHDSPYLWIGRLGALTEDGIYQTIAKRGLAAGLKLEDTVHVFRHSFSHYFRLNGGEEGDLQELGGWKSRAMLARYGKSVAVERARVAHRKFSPGDLV